MTNRETNTESGATNREKYSKEHPIASTRRAVLGGLSVTAAGSVMVGSVAGGKRRDATTPTLEGPITDGVPQTSAVHDIEEYGYTESEYLISGDAQPLGPPNPYPIDEREAPPRANAKYKTRLLVYRPKHRRDFNGTALIEWPNVSTGRDSPVAWINTFDYAMREGYAVVIASAQKVGVDDSPTDQDLRTGNPERYGDLHHPGDVYSYDIFSQAIRAIKTRPRPKPDPMAGFNVKHVIATGMSQSAQYLRYYLNEIQETHGLVDGFLPFATTHTPEEPADQRDDLVPVLWVVSEDEADRVRRSDSGLFKLWEVTGTSHINYWLMAWAGAMDVRDFEGDDPGWDPLEAGQYGERADADYGDCQGNYFPMRYAYKSGLSHVNEWVKRNEEPPAAPRIERDVASDGTVEVVTDEYGNAKGGLRLPPIDVPVAFYDARSCDSYGQTFRLEESELERLYPTHKAYVAKIREATEAAVDDGYLLPADADALLARAEASSIGK
ncbi:hypothetical protein SAMN04487967_2762 [Natronorubrum sediminis]|uniref:Alpha/beta hydrolase domain-containing protein n=2 Tax=Natronorubrum sediminis TaxID=640943 RepID=A0A1H6G0N3_9EURY|nr:hypothetical protein SAMN04487967_2762 [Natronorubrum sediminis]